MIAARSSREIWSRSLAALACVVLSVCTATPAFAADDEDEAIPDARLTGFADASGTPVKMDVGGGVALSYALVAVLGAISVGITFKNARRTHLD